MTQELIYEVWEMNEWQPFEGDYDKQHYDALLPDGTIVPYCWPNAGVLCATDGSGNTWSKGKCQYRVSALHPLDDPNPNKYQRFKP